MKHSKPLPILLVALNLAVPLFSQEPSPPPPPDLPDDNTGALAPTRPERPARTELANTLKEKLEDYKTKQDNLRKALKDRLAQIDNPTREKIRIATQAFELLHKDQLDALKARAALIKAELDAARPARPSKPLVSDEIKTQVISLQNQHKEVHDSLQASKAELKIALQDVTDEERAQLLDEFRQNQKDLHEQMKNIQRQIRETLHASLNTTDATTIRIEDRRPPSRTEVLEARRTADR